MATTMVGTLAGSSDLVQMIAREMAQGVETAVECWMSEIEHIFDDSRLTSLGRLNAVKDVLARYKRLSGKAHLEGRRA